MPDQNNPATPGSTPAPTAGPPVNKTPPVVTTDVDLPPLPPDFQNIPSTPPAETTEQTGASSPNDIPNIITSPPKKKFGGGRIIATILGILLLVGGVGTGVYLTRQQQILKSQASTCVDVDCAITRDITGRYHYDSTKDYHKSENLDGKNLTDQQYFEQNLSTTTNGTGGQGATCTDNGGCANGYSCSGGTCQGNPITTTCGRDQDPGAPVCCFGSKGGCSGGGSPVCEGHRQECKSGGGAGIFCTTDTDSSACGGTNPPQGNENPPSPSPSPSPTPGAPQCINVKAYSSEWTLLTDAELSALTPGTSVNFCVTGLADSGTFDKAQFKINSTIEPETTATRPGSTDFCQNYTILPADTSVSVLAKIHHAAQNVWVGETF